MTDDPNPSRRDPVIPALLRHARTAYGGAMRGALDRAGFGDIPANGLYVIEGRSLASG